MKPYQINLVNAISLISLGLWGYLASPTPSATALIPVTAGVLLAALTIPFKKGNRAVAHIAVGLSIVLAISLAKPLSGALDREDFAAAGRVLGMMAVNLFAITIFIKSFISARMKR